ncbi:hypothetical protein NQZ79_g6973 [Umbelopsis isabellina]|nr:hypothetical protein NQZ79_g6973 [Umbelopsis isabellina]
MDCPKWSPSEMFKNNSACEPITLQLPLDDHKHQRLARNHYTEHGQCIIKQPSVRLGLLDVLCLLPGCCGSRDFLSVLLQSGFRSGAGVDSESVPLEEISCLH